MKEFIQAVLFISLIGFLWVAIPVAAGVGGSILGSLLAGAFAVLIVWGLFKEAKEPKNP
jgi:hypothetical protein